MTAQNLVLRLATSQQKLDLASLTACEWQKALTNDEYMQRE